MLKVIISVLTFAISGAASADWASGGGELIQDSENPWFIQNTKTVKYCTQYDPDHYHQTPEITEDLLEKAIAFWKEEFRHGQTIFEPKITVATQDFVKVPCTRDLKQVDIVFQFGFLDEEQQTYVKNPNRYAALAIRTDYDKVNLRGKGFVYIAADSGPMKFQGENTVENPWNVNDGALLYWTMVHELGHVFGLSHTKQKMKYFDDYQMNVMSTFFIETIMNGPSSRWYKVSSRANPVFSVRYRRNDPPAWHCGGSHNYGKKLKEFFGVDSSWKCFGIKVMAKDLAVFATNLESSQSVLIGSATIASQTSGLVDDAMHFWLPPEQTVFPKGSMVHTPSFYVYDEVATYQTVSGQIQRQMSLSLDPRKSSPLRDDLKIGGVLNGKLYIDLLNSN